MTKTERKILYLLVVVAVLGFITDILHGSTVDKLCEYVRIKSGQTDLCTLDTIDCENGPETNEGPEWYVVPSEPSEARTASIQGHASWYEYEIGDWSSGDHYVCAIRHANDQQDRYPVDIDVPRGTFIQVIDMDTGKWSLCQVTDYGPDPSVFPERIVDLSPAVFADLGHTERGVLKNIKIQPL